MSMPTYDYKCKDCDKVFEHFQSMKDEPLTRCLCEKNGSVTRMISSGSGIIFKGSGFYVTDYKKSGAPDSSPSTPPPAATPAPAAPTSTPSGKSEP
jgi:putative FmdB family regulatory protein